MGGVLPPAEQRASALVALYVLLSLVLLMIGDRVPQAFLRGVGATLFAPLDRVVLVADRVATAWSENQDLHVRLAALELENTRLRLQGEENRRLREGLGLPGFRDPNLLAIRLGRKGDLAAGRGERHRSW